MEFFIILLAAATAVSAVHGGAGRVLTLEKVFPVNKTVDLHVLAARDRVRHARILQSFSGGIVDFNVVGTSDPYYGGLYFTKVKLGSPPKEFNVQIDTGSDILWVTCSSCSDCPQSSGFGIDLNFFDVGSSSSASTVSCSESVCSSIVQTSDASCSEGNQCSYKFQYGDGSGTSGHYVKDLFYFDTIVGPSMIANSSAYITFGPHYNLDLQSITVNGQMLPIDPAVFATSDNRGTIVDTGTTLTYLVADAFEPFVNAITSAVSQLTTPVLSKDTQCYLVTSSINEIFPEVSLNFAAGAAMILKPENYLVHGDPVEGGTPWCIGFQKVRNGVSILGDLVLKDKIFVYDLSKKRIGWTDYDCSNDVNVSITSSKDEYRYAGELSENSSSRTTCVLQALLLHVVAVTLGSSLW